MIFLLGGARSGKSKLAVQMARLSDRPVRMVATATSSDAEMEQRIRSHREHRPSDWVVVEEPIDVRTALGSAREEEAVLLDCVTLWIANLLLAHDDDTILATVDEAARVAARRESPTIVVSNEVGSGIVPMDPVGRRFRDLQGTANQLFASAAETAYLVVAGRTLTLGEPGVD